MKEDFDVFLSYNTKDRSEVMELAKRLRRFGVRVWLDVQRLLPGRDWQTELESVIERAPAVAVLFGKSGAGPWEEMETRAYLQEFVSRKLPVIPVILRNVDSDPADLPLFLRQFTWVDFRGGFGDFEMKNFVAGILGKSADEIESGQGIGRSPRLKPQTVLIAYCKANAEADADHEEIADTLRKTDPLRSDSSLTIIRWTERKLNAESEEVLRKDLDKAGAVVGVLTREFNGIAKKKPSIHLLKKYAREKGLNVFLFQCEKNVRPEDIFKPDKDASRILAFPRFNEFRSFQAARSGAMVEMVDEIRMSFQDPAYKPSPFPRLPSQRRKLDSLPRVEAVVRGRDKELKALDKHWKNKEVRLIVVKGTGGVGKTTLIRHWLGVLEAENFRGADPVFGWSFYSQSKEDPERTPKQVSTDYFFQEGLKAALPSRRGGSKKVSAFTGPRQKGEQLARRIGGLSDQGEKKKPPTRIVPRKSGLVVLDGIEPLVEDGSIVDLGLRHFVESMFEEGNQGLCVITTRNPLEFSPRFNSYIKEIDLSSASLDDGAAREILRLNGLEDDDKKLDELSGLLGNFPHPLALAAAFLRRRKAARCSPERFEALRRAVKTIRKNEGENWRKELKTDHYARVVVELFDATILDKEEKKALGFLAYFKGPASPDVLELLRGRRRTADIYANRNRKVRPKDPEWDGIIDDLEQYRLVERREDGDLDTHAVVREFYEKKFRSATGRPNRTWISAQRRLCDYYCRVGGVEGGLDEVISSNEEVLPPAGLEQTKVLFDAVVHGCRAEQFQEAWAVFWKCVRCGLKHRSGKTFGLWSSDQAALSLFFERQWDEPKKKLAATDQCQALNEAGYNLRAMGLPAESLVPLNRCLEFREESIGKGIEGGNDWGLEIAIAATGNLTKCHLALGDIEEAVKWARESMAHADRIGELKRGGKEWGWKVAARTWLGSALQCSGRFWEAEAAFRSAERIKIDQSDETEEDRLVDSNHYRFCKLLLDQAKLVGKGWVERSDRCLMPWLDVDSDPVLYRLGEVRDRTNALLETADKTGRRDRQGRWTLTETIYHLTLGNSWLLEAEYRRDNELGKWKSALRNAKKEVEASLQEIRIEGHQTYLLRALLCHSAYHRVAGSEAGDGKPATDLAFAKSNFDPAEKSLKEVLQIAAAGQMRLFEIDYHIEFACLQQARFAKLGDQDFRSESILALEDAEAMVREMNYRGRLIEIEGLKRELGPAAGRQKDSNGEETELPAADNRNRAQNNNTDAVEIVKPNQAIKLLKRDLESMGYRQSESDPRLILREDPAEAARIGGDLTECYLAAGRVADAVECAGWVVRSADACRVDDENESSRTRSEREERKAKEDVLRFRIESRTWLGRALHCSGHLWESEAAFRAAEEIEVNETRNSQLTDSSQHARFCELLLDQARLIGLGWVENSDRPMAPWLDVDSDTVLYHLREVRDRTMALEDLDLPIDSEETRCLRLCKCRSWLLEAEYLRKRRAENWQAALDEAERNLPEISSPAATGRPGLCIREWLNRASFFRTKAQIEKGDTSQWFEKAENALAEVLKISAPGGMLLFEVDYHLAMARLAWARSTESGSDGAPHRNRAILNLDDAAALVSATGYYCREIDATKLRAAYMGGQ